MHLQQMTWNPRAIGTEPKNVSPEPDGEPVPHAKYGICEFHPPTMTIFSFAEVEA